MDAPSLFCGLFGVDMSKLLLWLWLFGFILFVLSDDERLLFNIALPLDIADIAGRALEAVLRLSPSSPVAATRTPMERGDADDFSGAHMNDNNFQKHRKER
jgi:hypothetical protein